MTRAQIALVWIVCLIACVAFWLLAIYAAVRCGLVGAL